MKEKEEFYKLLAESYRLPVDLIKQLLELWNPRTHAKFCDFVEEMKREAVK